MAQKNCNKLYLLSSLFYSCSYCVSYTPTSQVVIFPYSLSARLFSPGGFFEKAIDYITKIFPQKWSFPFLPVSFGSITCLSPHLTIHSLSDNVIYLHGYVFGSGEFN